MFGSAPAAGVTRGPSGSSGLRSTTRAFLAFSCGAISAGAGGQPINEKGEQADRNGGIPPHHNRAHATRAVSRTVRAPISEVSAGFIVERYATKNRHHLKIERTNGASLAQACTGWNALGYFFDASKNLKGVYATLHVQGRLAC